MSYRNRRSIRSALLVLAFAAAGSASETPMAVSPGEASRLALIGDPCPTFSWGSVTGARSYELVVYRLEDDGERADPVLRRRLPGSVGSWTPSLEACLERGDRYGWSVRAVGGGGASDWSAPALFQVVSGPSQAELEAALELVRRYTATRAAPTARETVAEGTRADSSPDPETTARPTETAAPAATQLSVDGGVEAASFTGDGSTLTGLDPASMSSGTAGISITGAAGDVNCVGCITSTKIGTGQVTSAAIENGAVTVADIDPSTVQARVDGFCSINSSIRSIGSDGSVVCEVDGRTVGAGSFYVTAFNGQTNIALTTRQGRLCFLTYVSLRDVDGPSEEAWCQILAVEDDATGEPLWMLEARTDNDADARCRMHCIDLVDD